MVHPTALIEGPVTIHPSVEVGPFCYIRATEDKPVTIGEGTRVMSFVEIRPGTSIGKGCYLDSRVSISGNAWVGDGVTLRYGVILARGCKVGDRSYLCPRVMTNNLDTGQNSIGGAHIGEDCFIGTHAVLQHGITIESGTIVGAMSFVNKDCEKGTYIGSPARKLR